MKEAGPTVRMGALAMSSCSQVILPPGGSEATIGTSKMTSANRNLVTPRQFFTCLIRTQIALCQSFMLIVGAVTSLCSSSSECELCSS